MFEALLILGIGLTAGYLFVAYATEVKPGVNEPGLYRKLRKHTWDIELDNIHDSFVASDEDCYVNCPCGETWLHWSEEGWDCHTCGGKQ